MTTFIKTPPAISEPSWVLFHPYDIEAMMDHHDLDAQAREIVRNENLLPPSLLSRLHNNFPQHSLFKRKVTPLFKEGKNKYTGLSGFRMICKILKEHDIVLSHIKERELFIEVYAFLATKHILNTIDWDNYQSDPVFQLVFPQPNISQKRNM